MSDYVNNNLLDASPMRKQKEESQKLVAKWDKSGLLEGMDNDWQRSGMAVLLENQARQIISENSKTSPSAGGASAAPASGSAASSVILGTDPTSASAASAEAAAAAGRGSKINLHTSSSVPPATAWPFPPVTT